MGVHNTIYSVKKLCLDLHFVPKGCMHGATNANSMRRFRVGDDVEPQLLTPNQRTGLVFDWRLIANQLIPLNYIYKSNALVSSCIGYAQAKRRLFNCRCDEASGLGLSTRRLSIKYLRYPSHILRLANAPRYKRL